MIGSSLAWTWRGLPMVALGLLTFASMGCQSQQASQTTPAQAAVRVFDSDHADQRRRAVTRIAQAPFGGDPAYLHAYRGLTHDPDATVRVAAIQALAKRGEADDAKPIADRLDDDSNYVRWKAAEALQKVHHPAVIDSLIDALEDEDNDVRISATMALGQYARSDVFDALVGQLIDNDYAVERAARQSLVTLTGQRLGPEPADWLDWAENHRGQLFAAGHRYTYQPWTAPPGWLLRLASFGLADRPTPQPQRPTGI